MSDIRVGDVVQIYDNKKWTTHITPRWAYNSIGTVVRLNDLSVTVELDEFYNHERVRADYIDVRILQRKIAGDGER